MLSLRKVSRFFHGVFTTIYLWLSPRARLRQEIKADYKGSIKLYLRIGLEKLQPHVEKSQYEKLSERLAKTPVGFLNGVNEVREFYYELANVSGRLLTYAQEEKKTDRVVSILRAIDEFILSLNEWHDHYEGRVKDMEKMESLEEYGLVTPQEKLIIYEELPVGEWQRLWMECQREIESRLDDMIQLT